LRNINEAAARPPQESRGFDAETTRMTGSRQWRRHRVAFVALALAGLSGCASAIEDAARRQELVRLGTLMEEGRPVVLIGLEEQPRMPLLGTRLIRFGAAEEYWPPETRSIFSTQPAPPPT
jgi:hypothetical protein